MKTTKVWFLLLVVPLFGDHPKIHPRKRGLGRDASKSADRVQIHMTPTGEAKPQTRGRRVV